MAKQKVRSVLPVQNRANIRPWYHLYSGSLPLSWVQRHPAPVTEGTPSQPTAGSARSSGTTWAGHHGRLHLPRPLLASADRLLLPVIACFVWGKYTISAKKCQDEKTGGRPSSAYRWCAVRDVEDAVPYKREKETSRAMSLCMLSINGREDGEAVLPRLSKNLPGYKYRREG